MTLAQNVLYILHYLPPIATAETGVSSSGTVVFGGPYKSSSSESITIGDGS